MNGYLVDHNLVKVSTHEIQLVNYLVATGKPVGLLSNFGETKVEWTKGRSPFTQRRPLQPALRHTRPPPEIAPPPAPPKTADARANSARRSRRGHPPW